MINFGTVPAGAVLPIPFASYAAATGASVTLTGLAVTDIEVYKGVSMTQRSSDAGYVLMDTDGIDIDGITGIHGFSIDTGDNTDAGFYAAGAYCWVVVSAVTIDGQTVNFVAATFRMGPAENTAGTPVIDVGRISGDATAADNLEAACDNYSATRGLAGTALPAAAADAAGGLPISDAGALDLDAQVVTKVNSILEDTGTTLDGRIPAALVGGKMDSNVGAISGDTVAADNLEAAADGTGFNLGGGAVVAASVTGAVGSVTGAVGSVAGSVGGNVTGSIGSLAAQAKADVNAEVDAALDTAIPGSPTADSVNQRIRSMDLLTEAGGAGDLAAVLTDTADTQPKIGTPAGASLAADLAAVKSDTAATLLDTGTDGVVVAAASKSGYALSAAGVQAVWDALTAALTTAGSVGKRIADFLTGDAFVRLGAPAGASTAADIAAVKVDTAATLDDTGTAGVVVAAASKSGYALSAAGLDSISAADPNTITPTWAQMVVKVYRRLFRKSTMTATQLKTFGDDGSSVRTTQAVSDVGGTQTVGEET